MTSFFCNRVFDKGELKRLIHWFLINHGASKTLTMVDRLKGLGFHYATKAGISLGVEDLKIPPIKSRLLKNAEDEVYKNEIRFARGKVTAVEKSQKVIDIWNTTSELLKEEVVYHFRQTDLLNPVYMMAFSGARGNISQVRQLVGMRGLMSDPQGEIIDLPIKSNFREGLTVTEYIISCYGARKGLVDTALKTANSGYLTRRLVDVAQAVIINEVNCNTVEGIILDDVVDRTKIILSREKRLVGRVLSKTIQDPNTGKILGLRNQDICYHLAKKLNQLKATSILVRSPLTCQTSRHICQLCYGWSLAHGQLVHLGEAIGIIAAQSIGEPGTQLTMRTFHTGGVFSGEVIERVYAPHNGIIQYNLHESLKKVRTVYGQEAIFFTEKTDITIEEIGNKRTNLCFPPYTLIFTKPNKKVYVKQIIAEYSSFEQIAQRSDDPDGVLAIKEVFSDIAGQVYFHFFNNQGQVIKKQSTNLRIQGNGLLWVFSGKINSSLLFKQPLKKKGDFISATKRNNYLTKNLSYLEKQNNFFQTKVFSDGFFYKKFSQFNPDKYSLIWLPSSMTQKFNLSSEFDYLPEDFQQEDYFKNIEKQNLKLFHETSFCRNKIITTRRKLNALKQVSAEGFFETNKELQVKTYKKFIFSKYYLNQSYEVNGDSIYLSETFPSWVYIPKKKRSLLGPKEIKKQLESHHSINKPYKKIIDDIQFNEIVFSKWYQPLKVFCFQKIVSFPKITSTTLNKSTIEQTPSCCFVQEGSPLTKCFNQQRPHLNDLIDFQEEKQNMHELVCISENGQVLLKENKDQIKIVLNNQRSFVKTGSLVLKGDNIAEGIKATESGIVIQKTKNQITLRKGQPYRTSTSSRIVVSNNSIVLKGKTLFNLVYKKSKTGDIVQGLPKIEELLEARRTKDLQPIFNNPHDRLKKQFDFYKKAFNTEMAARKSLLETQQFLVDGVQSVYQSQGVNISDKHVEIIVKQMTSKVFIEDGGQTPFLYGDLVDLYQLKKINDEIAIKGQKLAKYEPIILGITKAALKAESFISAASFQETTRVLTQAAIQGKSDYFMGLKENVVVGQLIPAGTGFLRNQVSPLFDSYQPYLLIK